MNIKLPLNDLMLLVNKAETKGNVKEAISLIETHINNLEPFEQNIVQNVKEYLQKKLPQTAAEVSARVQVEMSSQLNKIKNLFSRVTKETILSDVNQMPVDRSEWSMLRENLNNNLEGLLHPYGRKFWLEQFFTGAIDGLTGKEADLRFMEGAQRLIDLGIIDNSTLVIIHTGHNIPIAGKLAENTSRLGNVNGVLEISRESFPLMGKRVEEILQLFAEGKGHLAGLSAEETAILQKKIEPFKKKILYGGEHENKLLEGYLREIFENTERVSNQAYTYPGMLKQKTEGKGAKFLGIDFHRTGRIDTSKLPSARELKESGIKKVVFLEEAPPLSSFSQAAAEKLYEPMTKEKADKIAYYFDTFVHNLYQKKVKEGLQAFDELEKMITPKEISHKITSPDAGEISAAQAKIKDGTFGYKIQHITREDITPYLESLNKEMPLLIEGVDINKLEIIPFNLIPSAIDNFVKTERALFRETASFTDLIAYIENLSK